jgi:hypothetical protein
MLERADLGIVRVGKQESEIEISTSVQKDAAHDENDQR